MDRLQKMKSGVIRAGFMGAVAAVLIWLCGCDWKDENHRRHDIDHVPPAGQGSLVIDNLTDTDADVFVDGTARGRAGDDSVRTIDLAPGLYRVVLDEVDGHRAYRADIDVLDGKLSVLEVRTESGDFDSYKVSLRCD